MVYSCNTMLFKNIRDHSFSTFTIFSEKLTFLTRLIRGLEMLVFWKLLCTKWIISYELKEKSFQIFVEIAAVSCISSAYIIMIRWVKIDATDDSYAFRENCPNTGFFFFFYFPAFGPNAAKYGPEKNPCLDTFYAVMPLLKLKASDCYLIEEWLCQSKKWSSFVY